VIVINVFYSLGTMKISGVLLFCGVVFLSVIVSTSGKYEGEADILGQNNLSICTIFDRNTLAVSGNKSVHKRKSFTFLLCVHL